MLKRKIIRNLFFCITMWLVCVAKIVAVPASPNIMEITQPNGSKFRAYLKGDEYFSWWESEKGLILYRNLDSGYFEYAKFSIIDEIEVLVPTGIIFISEEEKFTSNLRVSKLTKLKLGKIWMEKRKQARKRFKEILEKQRNSRNQ